MTDTRYNGWTNRATWAVALHINNDAGVQEMVQEWAEEAVRENPDDADNATHWLANQLNGWYDSESDEFWDAAHAASPWVALLLRDLVDDAVDWFEIAQTFVQEVNA